MIKETLSKQKVFNYWNDALAIERFHQPKLFQIANAAKITNSGKWLPILENSSTNLFHVFRRSRLSQTLNQTSDW